MRLAVAEAALLGSRRMALQDMVSLHNNVVWLPLKDVDLLQPTDGMVLVKIEMVFDRWNAAMSLRNTPTPLICTCGSVAGPWRVRGCYCAL